MTDNLSIIKNIFQLNNIAVVGMSPKTERPSNYVALYMRNQGYNIIPVNPGQKSIQNEMCYPSLTSIPHQVDIVNVFRRSEYVLPIAQDAIAIGAKALWLQDGVINEEASKIAQEAG
ncbi:uncharacterized protein METZ01_LOCUS172720, partial [marine metagenome]